MHSNIMATTIMIVKSTIVITIVDQLSWQWITIVLLPSPIVHVIVLHQEYSQLCTGLAFKLLLWLSHMVFMHRLCVPQELNFRLNYKFKGYRIESLLSLSIHTAAIVVPFSVHSTTIVTNMLINLAGSYYVITNIRIEASYIPLLRWYHCSTISSL